MLHRRILLLIALVAGATLVACGGDDGNTTGAAATGSTSEATTGSGDTETACAAVADINAFDDEIEEKLSPVIQKLQSNPDAATVDQFVDELTNVTADIEKDLPSVNEAYDRLKSGAPDDVVKDIDAVKEGTAEILTVLKKIDSPDDFQTFQADITGNAAIVAAGQATLRLDTYTKKTCNVGIAD
jgi:archaellum component FlaC